MKTVTFYSYKGGVGRSLALSNIAIRLSELNKKVCVLDFDLEAPGLHFKFKNYKRSRKIEKGIVDYIYQFSNNGILPNSIKDYSISLKPSNNYFESIELIPAGNIDDVSYWKKLSMIKWSDMFYSEKGQGVKFILDLKSKIQKDLSPDFLLIDSRTGITDISGITLKLLADEIVILAANNEENISGCQRIIKSIIENPNPLFKEQQIHFILTRLPFTDTPKDIEKEFQITERLKDRFKRFLNKDEFDISVIHSDRRLEESERPLIGFDYEEKGVSISNDYLKLFDKITKNVLSDEEIQKFKNKKLAEKEFNKSKTVSEYALKIQHLNNAIELDPSIYEYYLDRALFYYTLRDIDSAISNFEKVLELNPNESATYTDLAYTIFKFKNENQTAINYLNKAIDIDPNYIKAYLIKSQVLKSVGDKQKALELLNYVIDNIDSNDPVAYNTRADLYRELENYKLAYADIYKAIELNSSHPVFFGTLAEIYACDGKIEEFYLNLTIALSRGITASSLNSAKDVYSRFRTDERFINLLNKYNIDIEEIFSDNIEI